MKKFKLSNYFYNIDEVNPVLAFIKKNVKKTVQTAAFLGGFPTIFESLQEDTNLYYPYINCSYQSFNNLIFYSFMDRTNLSKPKK